jgi:hypothetical protein
MAYHLAVLLKAQGSRLAAVAVTPGWVPATSLGRAAPWPLGLLYKVGPRPALPGMRLVGAEGSPAVQSWGMARRSACSPLRPSLPALPSPSFLEGPALPPIAAHTSPLPLASHSPHTSPLPLASHSPHTSPLPLARSTCSRCCPSRYRCARARDGWWRPPATRASRRAPTSAPARRCGAVPRRGARTGEGRAGGGCSECGSVPCGCSHGRRTRPPAPPSEPSPCAPLLTRDRPGRPGVCSCVLERERIPSCVRVPRFPTRQVPSSNASYDAFAAQELWQLSGADGGALDDGPHSKSMNST